MLVPRRMRRAVSAVYAFARRADDFADEPGYTDVERLRELFAGLIGATADGVALVPATSYGFAVAARALGVGPADRVLVLAEEYPSGVYTWRAGGPRGPG